MPSRYFSDLTEAQWGRVRSDVFSGHSDPAPLRRIIDGLRFRARAWCPWPLTPADFPDAADLRRCASEWAANGLWERITAAAEFTPAPVASVQPPSLRRSVARTIKRLPGGTALLLPGRKLIHVVQYLRNRQAPITRLPEIFRAGVDALLRKEYAVAVDQFTHVLEAHPSNGEACVNLGIARRQLGRPAEARDDFLTALSVPDLTLEVRTQANAHLAEAYLLCGDIDRAIGHSYMSRLLTHYGSDVPWDRDELAEDPDEFEALSEAHSDVAEIALKFAPDAFAPVFARRRVVQAEYERRMGDAIRDTHYLSEEWVRAVGHIALIDFWVKMQRLGWLGKDRIVLHAPPQTIANTAYFRYFEPLLHVVPNPAPGGATRHLAATLGPRISAQLRIPGHPERMFLAATGTIQHEWERQRRGPLLKLTTEDVAFGREKLRRMGVPDGAWFVGLHVRSSGFHREQDRALQDQRNADIASYLPLIHEVVRRGGWVIRLGDKSMPPLPPTPGAIDYATGPHKCPRTDVFLCGACRFFVAVASGLGNLPTSFGVPCLTTNWVAHVLPVAGRHDRFVPKLMWSEAAGRVLTFDEWLRPETRFRFLLGTEIRAGGLRPVDNTADELRAAAAEMLDRLDGRQPDNAADDPADARRREAFDRLARRHGLVGFAPVAGDFLRRHEALLGDPGAARKAG